MKNTYIFICNMNRFECLRKLISFLKCKNYNNIVVLDNKSTYKPLLDWYNSENINVLYCKENYGHNALDLCKINEPEFIEKYLDIVEKEYYVYTDSDVLPIDDIPQNFIDDMIDMAKTHKIPKLGLGLKIDDIPDHFFLKDHVIHHESFHFTFGYIEDYRCLLFSAGVDTTFAINSPGMKCGHNPAAYRTSGNYFARHLPWYYDSKNLPEDEKYYIKNATSFTHWTDWIKRTLSI